MKFSIVCITVALGMTLSAEAQDFSASVPRDRRELSQEQETQPAPAPSRGKFRIRELLQWINPFAGPEYGSGIEMVSTEEGTFERQGFGFTGSDDRTHQYVRARGIRIFSIAF